MFTVGDGLPTAPTNEVQLLPGFPNTGPSAPLDFAVLDLDSNSAADTIYVADDRTGSGGGIQKWTYDGSTWWLASTWSVGPGIGARHLIAVESLGPVTVLVATTTAAPNAVVKVVDEGPNSIVTTLATATGSDTAFRGLALSPVP